MLTTRTGAPGPTAGGPFRTGAAGPLIQDRDRSTRPSPLTTRSTAQRPLTRNQDRGAGITAVGPFRTGAPGPLKAGPGHWGRYSGTPRTGTGAAGSRIQNQDLGTGTPAPGPFHRNRDRSTGPPLARSRDRGCRLPCTQLGPGHRDHNSESPRNRDRRCSSLISRTCAPGPRRWDPPAPGPGPRAASLSTGAPRPLGTGAAASPARRHLRARGSRAEAPRPLIASELPNEIAENVRTTKCVYWAKGRDAPRRSAPHTLAGPGARTRGGTARRRRRSPPTEAEGEPRAGRARRRLRALGGARRRRGARGRRRVRAEGGGYGAGGGCGSPPLWRPGAGRGGASLPPSSLPPSLPSFLPLPRRAAASGPGREGWGSGGGARRRRRRGGGGIWREIGYIVPNSP